MVKQVSRDSRPRTGCFSGQRGIDQVGCESQGSRFIAGRLERQPVAGNENGLRRLEGGMFRLGGLRSLSPLHRLKELAARFGDSLPQAGGSQQRLALPRRWTYRARMDRIQ